MFGSDLKLRVNDNLYLNSPLPNDAPKLFQLIDKNRDYLREWLPWLDLNTKISDSLSFIEQSIEDQANEKALVLMICFRNRIVGVIGFNGLDHQNRSCTIGYWIGQEFQGKGITSESTKRLIKYAFNELEMNRVAIDAATKNVKSKAIPERLGFRLEGVAREIEWLYDHFVDITRYAITRNEWSELAED